MKAQNNIEQYRRLVKEIRSLMSQLNSLLPSDYDASFEVKNGHGGDAQQSVGLAEECIDEALDAYLLAHNAYCWKVRQGFICRDCFNNEPQGFPIHQQDLSQYSIDTQCCQCMGPFDTSTIST